MAWYSEKGFESPEAREVRVRYVYAAWRFIKWLDGGMSYEQIDEAVARGEIVPDYSILNNDRTTPRTAPCEPSASTNTSSSSNAPK